MTTSQRGNALSLVVGEEELWLSVYITKHYARRASVSNEVDNVSHLFMYIRFSNELA